MAQRKKTTEIRVRIVIELVLNEPCLLDDNSDQTDEDTPTDGENRTDPKDVDMGDYTYRWINEQTIIMKRWGTHLPMEQKQTRQ